MLSNTAHGSSRNRNHVSTIHLVYLAISINLIKHKDVRFGPKVGQSGSKWDKSGTFSDQISVHFDAAPECTEIASEKVPSCSHF